MMNIFPKRLSNRPDFFGGRFPSEQIVPGTVVIDDEESDFGAVGSGKGIASVADELDPAFVDNVSEFVKSGRSVADLPAFRAVMHEGVSRQVEFDQTERISEVND
jgi:hypothetical protein